MKRLWIGISIIIGISILLGQDRIGPWGRHGMIGHGSSNISGRIDSLNVNLQKWTYGDSNSVFVLPPLSFGEEFSGANYAVNPNGTKLFSIKPRAGHVGVHLNSILLNVLYVRPDMPIFAVMGSGRIDSTVWYAKFCLIAFKDGLADTVTEDQNGIGIYMTLGGFSGFIHPVPYRGGSAFSELICSDRRITYNAAAGPDSADCHKNAVIIIRPVINADSIQLWAKRVSRPCRSNQTIYYAVSYASFPSWDNIIKRSLHIQHIDTMCAREDWVKLAGQNYEDCRFYFHSFYVSRRFGSLWSGTYNGIRGTAVNDFHNVQLEEDLFFFDQSRPVIDCRLASGFSDADGQLSPSSFVYVTPPNWWQGRWANFENYRNPNAKNSRYFQTFIQAFGNATLGTDTSLWIYGNASLDSGAGGNVWKVRLGATTADSIFRSYPTRSRVRFIGSDVISYLGTEDIVSGYYDNNLQLPFYMGHSFGTPLLDNSSVSTRDDPTVSIHLNIALGAGIDSLWGAACSRRSTYLHYRAWYPEYGNIPLRFPNGFEFYYQKGGYVAQTLSLGSRSVRDTLTWQVQSTNVFYSFDTPRAIPIGRCCYHQGWDCVDSVTYMECLETYGGGNADSIRWKQGGRCYELCALFDEFSDSIGMSKGLTMYCNDDSTWFDNNCANSAIATIGWESSSSLRRFYARWLWNIESTDTAWDWRSHYMEFPLIELGQESDVDSCRMYFYKTRDGDADYWVDTLAVCGWSGMDGDTIAAPTVNEINSMVKTAWGTMPLSSTILATDNAWFSLLLNADSIESYLGKTLKLGFTFDRVRNHCARPGVMPPREMYFRNDSIYAVPPKLPYLKIWGKNKTIEPP